MTDNNVNHPKHYNSNLSGVECIDIVEHMTFNVGNAIKYLWRAGLKGDKQHLEDLCKAEWYVRREIQRINTPEKIDSLLSAPCSEASSGGDWHDAGVAGDACGVGNECGRLGCPECQQ